MDGEASWLLDMRNAKESRVVLVVSLVLSTKIDMNGEQRMRGEEKRVPPGLQVLSPPGAYGEGAGASTGRRYRGLVPSVCANCHGSQVPAHGVHDVHDVHPIL